MQRQLGGTAVGFANAVSSMLYALTIPLAVIAVTLAVALTLILRGGGDSRWESKMQPTAPDILPELTEPTEPSFNEPE